MQDMLDLLTTLRRPHLLIRAARIGAQDYRRGTHLRRHLGYGPLPQSAPALHQLVEIEAALDQQRRRSDAGYSPVRHVEILIAMMGEARILRAAHPAAIT